MILLDCKICLTVLYDIENWVVMVGISFELSGVKIDDMQNDFNW